MNAAIKTNSGSDKAQLNDTRIASQIFKINPNYNCKSSQQNVIHRHRSSDTFATNQRDNNYKCHNHAKYH